MCVCYLSCYIDVICLHLNDLVSLWTSYLLYCQIKTNISTVTVLQTLNLECIAIY